MSHIRTLSLTISFLCSILTVCGKGTCDMDFDQISDSIETVQISYAKERKDSFLLCDIIYRRFNELRKRSRILQKLKRECGTACCESRNDTIILLDMTNCEGFSYYSQAWNTQRKEELQMYRFLKDSVVYIDEELLILAKNDEEEIRYRQLCNDWRPDIFQKEWTQRSESRTGCWSYLVTRIIFADDKVLKIDFEYII